MRKFMKTIHLISTFIVVYLSSLMGNCLTQDGNDIEAEALKKNIVGKIYIHNLTGKSECNKTRIRYLGTIRTNKGKCYKILTAFYVIGNSCRGNSSIKIYDMKNKYVGHYYVGMAYELPDHLNNNRLLFLEKSEECNVRKNFSIDLAKGLPSNIFIPCSKNNGNIYNFSSE